MTDTQTTADPEFLAFMAERLDTAEGKTTDNKLLMQTAAVEFALNGRRLLAEIESLRTALRECSDDLAAEIEGRYRGEQDTYSSEMRRYRRDMATVVRARALLGPDVLVEQAES